MGFNATVRFPAWALKITSPLNSVVVWMPSSNSLLLPALVRIVDKFIVQLNAQPRKSFRGNRTAAKAFGENGLR